MSDIIGKIYMLLGLKKEGFDKGMQHAEKRTGSLGKAFKKLGGVIAAAFSVAIITNFIKSAIKAYDTQKKAEASLLTALKGRKDIQQRLIWQAQELQRKTLYGDEETIKAAARLATTIGANETALRKLLPLVQDFATGKGMDLAAAAELIGKTLGSSTNALSRYGIEVEGAANSAERLDSLVRALNEGFAGQAEAAAKAGTGAIKQMANMWGDFKENVAGALIKTGELKRLLEGLKKVLDGFFDMEGMSEGIDAGRKMVQSFADRSKDWKKDFFSNQITSLKEEIDPLQKKLDKLTTGWTVLGQHFVWNKKKAKELKEEINYLTGQMKVYENQLESLNNTEETRSGSITKQVKLTKEQIKAQKELNALRREAATAMKLSPMTARVSAATGAPMTAGMADMSGVIDRNNQLTDGLVDNMNRIQASSINMKDAISQLGYIGAEAFSQAITGIVNGSATMEQALKGTLGMVADFGVQFGEALISAGIGKTMFDTFFTVPGPAMIAAGAGMVAIFSAIKGLVNKGPFQPGAGGYAPSYTPAQTNQSANLTQRIELYAILRGDQIELTTRKSAARSERIG